MLAPNDAVELITMRLVAELFKDELPTEGTSLLCVEYIMLAQARQGPTRELVLQEHITVNKNI